jgi:hypothetical protein
MANQQNENPDQYKPMNWRFRRLYSQIGLYLAPVVTAPLVATSAIDTHNQVEKMEEIARENTD